MGVTSVLYGDKILMTIEDIILYLRQQLLELRNAQDRQSISELLSTFKMLTKASFENGDKALTAILVSLTDAARDLYMGKALNGSVPSEEDVRAAVKKAVAVGMTMPTSAAPVSVPATLTPIAPLKPSSNLPEADQPINALTTQELVVLEDSYNDELALQARLRRVAERDWRDYTHLRDGNTRQMRAYTTVFDDLMIFKHFTAHEPLWVGSYPIEIDIESSPIHIMLNPTNLREFLLGVKNRYGEQDGFKLTWKAIQRIPTVIARFSANEFAVELFAQPRSTTTQHAFTQMLVEARLLAIGGSKAYEGVRELKRKGLSTEAAFAAYFGLEGSDPYQMLVDLARVDNDTLRRRITISGS